MSSYIKNVNGSKSTIRGKKIPNWLIKQSTFYIYTGDVQTFKKAGKKSMGKINKAYKNIKKIRRLDLDTR